MLFIYTLVNKFYDSHIEMIEMRRDFDCERIRFGYLMTIIR